MLKLIRNVRGKDIFFFLLVILCIVSQVYLDLKLPEFMSNIVREVVSDGKLSSVLYLGAKMLGCALGSSVLAVITGYFIAIITSNMAYNIRTKVYKKIQSFSPNEFKEFSTASLITRTTNDITQIQSTTAISMQVLIKSPVLAIWAILKITNINISWSITTAVAVGVLILTISVIMAVTIKKFKKMQKLTDDINRKTRESLTGIRVVRAFNAEKFQEERFEKTNEELTSNNLFVHRVMSILSPVISLVMNFMNLAIYWIGAYLVDKASPLNFEKVNLLSNMMVFTSYAMQIILSFMMLTMIFIMLPRAQVCASRVNEVLDKNNSIVYGNVLAGSNSKTSIEYKNVCFKYPNAEEYVLKDISFKAEAGQTIAFIGSTGSGKSTLINLIPRFYDATSGEILIDGVNILDYDKKALNNKLGYVSQRAILFKGSVKDNITMGESENGKPNDSDVENALKISQSKEFVDKLPDGVNSMIAQGGTNVSGGQKQRLSIARALSRNPEILIFDDSFSALDYKTDLLLRNELKKNKFAIKLVVAQRIGTIKDADKIIVLDNGSMAGIGTHKELLKSCKVYQEIAESQLSKEELDNA